MSKKKRKSLQAPSQTPERYLSHLKQSSTSETSGTAPTQDEVDSTDSKVHDERIFTKKSTKRDGFKRFLNDFGISLGIFIAIVTAVTIVIQVSGFLGNLSNNMNNLETQVTRVESDTKSSLKEIENSQNNVQLALTKIVEKFDRLFDLLNGQNRNNYDKDSKEK